LNTSHRSKTLSTPQGSADCMAIKDQDAKHTALSLQAPQTNWRHALQSNV